MLIVSGGKDPARSAPGKLRHFAAGTVLCAIQGPAVCSRVTGAAQAAPVVSAVETAVCPPSAMAEMCGPNLGPESAGEKRKAEKKPTLPVALGLRMARRTESKAEPMQDLWPWKPKGLSQVNAGSTPSSSSLAHPVRLRSLDVGY
ncbi:uncharacterized protein LOC740860 [Pan troglodytes]|uniref:uncharacterized protein LOC740860 n=1 Tax=Pan troglodytes TaxID=9598 RepID=UPI0000E21DD3|nr:uncharacterized protein LOC740860 [Pan troglodytes]